MADEQDSPKIFVDSDWKEQAKREKEELDRQTREQEDQGQEIPGASFLEIVEMIAMQASIGLGGYQDPNTGGRIPPNLGLAKHYIDLMDVLREKTKNNLEEQEQQLLDATAHELRMAFVQIAQAIQAHLQKQAAGGGEPQA